MQTYFGEQAKNQFVKEMIFAAAPERLATATMPLIQSTLYALPGYMTEPSSDSFAPSVA